MGLGGRGGGPPSRSCPSRARDPGSEPPPLSPRRGPPPDAARGRARVRVARPGAFGVPRGPDARGVALVGSPGPQGASEAPPLRRRSPRRGREPLRRRRDRRLPDRVQPAPGTSHLPGVPSCLAPPSCSTTQAQAPARPSPRSLKPSDSPATSAKTAGSSSTSPGAGRAGGATSVRPSAKQSPPSVASPESAASSRTLGTWRTPSLSGPTGSALNSRQRSAGQRPTWGLAHLASRSRSFGATSSLGIWDRSQTPTSGRRSAPFAARRPGAAASAATRASTSAGEGGSERPRAETQRPSSTSWPTLGARNPARAPS